jgi:hypothetical protein
MGLGSLLPKQKGMKTFEFKNPVTSTGVPTTISSLATRGTTPGTLVQGASGTRATIPTPTNDKLQAPKLNLGTQASCRDALKVLEKFAAQVSPEYLEKLAKEVVEETLQQYPG